MSESTGPAATAYPVSYDIEPQIRDRNRTTTFWRFFLAFPHLMILGGGSFAAGRVANSWGGNIGGSGLGGAAFTMAIVAWFAIIFWKTHPRGLWDFTGYYLRWLGRASAYFALLRDDYPPFGDGDYPARFSIADMPADAARDRWAVGLRVIYAIPHVVVLILLGIAWLIVTIIAWFAILFTGSYPEGMYNFSVGYLRWSLRVEAYALLMTDIYPPFSLEA